MTWKDKKKLGFAEKEIEKVQSTKSRITWNNSCVRNWERRGSAETKNDFLLGAKKKEKEDKWKSHNKWSIV